jgi:Ca2+-binding EF-hand superfamily protein
VDRETFEVGLKGLDMNPGDELIKNICHFGDFINWEQFIKIISISLRKTPEEKLSAILKGISSFDDGYLSQHQISLMIGNSLQKIFDRPVPELDEYFTSMAMREFDEAGEGRVSV